MFRSIRGLSDKEAAERVRKFHPIYGDLEDTTHTTGNDSPLPIELKDRINKYIESRASKPEEMKQKIESHSSFNALVREEIKNGNI